MAQDGYLLLIDLSGYTAFLSQSGLEEGAGILQSLLGTVLEHIEPPLEVVELEGDAVFVYAPDGSFRSGQTLIEVLERLYCVFAAAREQMQHNATCDCSGCTLIPHLDAKMVAHHGEFVLSRMKASRPKPVGTDVILVHRLLKNRITEATGVISYAFVTDACARRLELDWLKERARRHSETYDHIGPVTGWVYDLAPAWAKDREARLVSVDAEQAWIQAHIEIDASTQVVWDLISAPDFKRRWHRARRVEVLGGRAGPGTEYRCYSGERIKIAKVVDWQPFRRLTLDCEWPLGARVFTTLELTPHGTGTRLVARLGMPRGTGRAHNLLVRLVYRWRRKEIERRCRDDLRTLGDGPTAPE